MNKKIRSIFREVLACLQAENNIEVSLEGERMGEIVLAETCVLGGCDINPEPVNPILEEDLDPLPLATADVKDMPGLELIDDERDNPSGGIQNHLASAGKELRPVEVHRHGFPSARVRAK
jgi:hypothetical protein